LLSQYEPAAGFTFQDGPIFKKMADSPSAKPVIKYLKPISILYTKGVDLQTSNKFSCTFTASVLRQACADFLLHHCILGLLLPIFICN